jgi:hypothetical protein
VFSYTSPASQFFYSLDGTGHFVSRQPSFLDIAGVAAPTQIPFPSSISIGGVKSYTAPSGQYLTGISTDGTVTSTIPAGGVAQTNEFLKTTVGSPGLRVLRAGFAIPGDGGMAYYDWSALNCVNADNGAQVQPTGVTGCWIADFSTGPRDIRQFGGKPDGTTDNLLAFNAARDSCAYVSNTPQSGCSIRFGGEGTYRTTGSFNTTAKNGLKISGAGIGTTVVFGDGNFPVFVDNGTITAGTAFVGLKDLTIRCGGKANANANGVTWIYSYLGSLENLMFYACNKSVNFEKAAWQVHMSHIRGDGSGALQSNYGLYMAEADPANPVINMTVVANDVWFGNNAVNAYRLINFQGSKFVNVEGGGSGSDVWSLCDPPTGTAPCQWGHFVNILADTAPADVTKSGIRIVRGNASEMSQFYMGGVWIGNIFGEAASNAAALYVDGGAGGLGNSIVIDVGTIAGVHAAVVAKNLYNSDIAARVVKFDGGNTSDKAFLINNSSGNKFTAHGIPTSLYAITGYNGYAETGTSANNSIFGFGQAPCTSVLQFGGAAAGISYATNYPACTYDVDGQKVRAQVAIGLTNKGGSTGAATISGLPFAASGTASGFANIGNCAGGDGSGTKSLASLTGPILTQATGSSFKLFTQAAADTAVITNANFTNTSLIQCNVNYQKQ